MFMTFKMKPSWGAYIHKLMNKPHEDRTDEENYILLFHDVMSTYEGINKPSDITPEIEEHYYGIKDKELTAIHREIFDLNRDERNIDIKDPCRPGKLHLKQKGESIDRLCEILGIKKNSNFHSQIKHTRIYEEDIKQSEWYRYVLQNKWELREIFGYEVGKDFEDSPLRYFKTFCFKIMGILCSLEQPKGMFPDDHEQCFKQHMKEDIYRKHYGETPRTPTNKRKYSDDWINRKIKDGVGLSIAEQKLRALRKHVEIHKKQPQCKRYLSTRDNFTLIKLREKEQFKNTKQNGRTLG